MSDSDNLSQSPDQLSAAQYAFRCPKLAAVHWHVRQFNLTEALSEPYRLTVELLAEDHDLAVDAMLGAPCQFQIAVGVVARVVHGIVERVHELGALADRSAYVLDVVPAFALRAQQVDTRFFQEMSVPEIVGAVLNDVLTASGRTLRMDLDAAAYEKREYCVQYRETDFEFVSRLLQEEGIAYSFEHPPEEDAEILVLVDDTTTYPPLALIDGGEQVLYVPRTRSVARRSSVDGLTPIHALRSTGVVQRDFDWMKPSESPYTHNRNVSGDFTPREVYDHDERRQFSDDGAKRTRRKLDLHNMQTRVYRGTGDVVEFIPGRAFELAGHPQHTLDREHLLVRVHHRGEALEDDLFVQKQTERKPRYTNEFECIDHDVRWRPEALYHKPRAYGLQTAIVVGPETEEIHTDEHGRIKVRFHWDRISPFDDTASCWIRVSQTAAGRGWGALVLPRVGMEVLVEFIDGDPDRPVVTGCVYNGDNPPPYALPDDKTKSTMKSDTSPGGGGSNELRFEDAKGAEEIYIHAQLDMKTEVVRDAARTVGRDDGGNVGRHQNYSVGVDRTASVGNNENLSVGANQSLTVGANQTNTIGANQTNKVGANQSTTVGAAMSLSVGAAMSMSVGANQSLSVSGNQSITLGGNHTLSAGGTSSLTIGGSSTTKVGGPLTISCGGAASLTFSAAHTLSVGAARTTNVGGGDTLTVSGALAITAASISLSAGGSTIEIGPGGINITSGALVNVNGATVNVNS